MTGIPRFLSVPTAPIAIEAAREGRVLAEQVGDRWLVAVADAVEGAARGHSVDGLIDAASLFERAGHGYAELGDRQSAAINVWYLSQVLEDVGATERARAAVTPFVGTTDVLQTASEILASSRLSWLAQRDGDTALAVQSARRLASIPTFQERRLFWGAAQFAIGHAALVSGDLEHASTALTASLDVHTPVGFERFVILSHALLGQVAARAGDDHRAGAHHEEAIRRAEVHPLPLPLVLALEFAADTACRQQRQVDATQLQRRADELRARHGLEPTPQERARADAAYGT